MKAPTQQELIKSVRKPMAPAVKVERPVKGKNGYRRKNKFHRPIEAE